MADGVASAALLEHWCLVSGVAKSIMGVSDAMVRCGDTAGRKISDLKEARGVGIDGWFCHVLFVIADGRYLASCWVSPGLAREQARQDEAVAYLADTVHGMADECVRAGLVIGKDARCPEGSMQDCGVQDVLGGLSDGAFGCIVDPEGNR